MSSTNKNTMYIVVAALVIIIVIVGVGAYVFLGGGGGGGGNGNGGEEVITVSNATSLQYSVNFTDASGITGLYKFSGKNLGTENLMIRVEIEGGDTDYIYILNAGNETAWANLDGTWTDLSSTFAEQWNSWGTQWTGYVAHNPDWKTGDSDITYTDSGNSITIYGITINPTLADSLFTPA